MPRKKVTPPVEPGEAIVPLVSGMPAPAASIQSAEPAAPAAPTPLPTPQPLSASDEKTWSMLAHLSVLLNLLTGFGGPIAALIIYLVYKDRSRLVAYHALQAMIFQLIWWFGGPILIGVMWAIVGMLSVVLIGLLLIPVAAILTPVLLLMPLVSIVYGIIGAVQTSQGQDFKYWLVGDWVRGTLSK